MLRQVMATLYPRSEHTKAYRNLLAELLRVVGGPGADRVTAIKGGAEVEGSEKAEGGKQKAEVGGTGSAEGQGQAEGELLPSAFRLLPSNA